ncbi:hypothetical protein D0Z00_004492 [Geotrichum galactomycetum]|uniref:Uncharacterized protein n=1 Tax=Geotrichum galactomycetum TaxID=27317 RepID=A0ACB6UY94_9ASCO|nr:hypothetical protein D0Z00_004492 [Geotrichum candidum]
MYIQQAQPPLQTGRVNRYFSWGLYSHIFKNNDYEPVKDLKDLVQSTGSTTTVQALTILVNLCDNQTILESLASDEKLVEYVANQVCNTRQKHADLFCIFLANLAKRDQITAIFKMKFTPPKVPEGVDPKDLEPPAFETGANIMDCLLDCFVRGSDRSFNKFANFDYLAYFFADLSRFKQGRDYFITLRDDGYPITKLLVFTEIESKIRRTGVASTIKNCLFDIPFHEKFIFDDSINLLPYILLPLADGSDEIPEDEMFELPDELQFLSEDKKRDSDNTILATYVECLLLLSTTKKIRSHLRDKSVYSIIRALHKGLEVDEVQDPCERLVQVLMRDDHENIEDIHKIKEVDEDEEEDDDDIIEVL